MIVRQAMSKRILGVGIVLGGLIVLVIALIIGIGFPKFVFETNLKAVCIQDSSHPRYKFWVCCYIRLCDRIIVLRRLRFKHPSGSGS